MEEEYDGNSFPDITFPDIEFSDNENEDGDDEGGVGGDKEGVSNDKEGMSNGPGTLGTQVLSCWENCKCKLDHDYSITGWVLCVIPEVRADVENRMNDVHRDAVERVVERLHLPPCPNKQVNTDAMTPSDIIDLFWVEYKELP